MDPKASRVSRKRVLVKNPFEERQRQIDLKNKREADEQAALLKSFVSSFEEPATSVSSFVPATAITPNISKAVPISAPIPTIPVSVVSERNVANLAEPLLKKSKKTKNIDLFLEELKKEAEHDLLSPPMRPPHPAFVSTSSQRGSYANDNDNLSTNLYIGNLSPSMTETKLLLEFGKFGPIGSIKIMWPRTADDFEKTRTSKCGFVSFMCREDASDALRELQGYELEGCPLRMNWGKSVPLPPQALPMPSQSGASLDINAPNLDLTFSIAKETTKINVIMPEDKLERTIIDLAAQFTAKYGMEFERQLMQSEPSWAFLFNRSRADHIYYRWKVYSIAAGDRVDSWRTSPFTMTWAGPFWMPPSLVVPISSATQASLSNQHITNNDKPTLGTMHRKTLDQLLKKLTLSRLSIERIMCFGMDHADHANEICSIILNRFKDLSPSEQMSPRSTPALDAVEDAAGKFSRLVPYFYLVSDVLHNSSAATVRNAWNYRSCLETILPEMFERLHRQHSRITGRITAEQQKEKIVRLLRLWHSWSIYPGDMIASWESIISPFTATGPVAPSGAVCDSSDDGEPIDVDSDSVMAPTLAASDHQNDVDDDDDIDGVPFDI